MALMVARRRTEDPKACGLASLCGYTFEWNVRVWRTRESAL